MSDAIPRPRDPATASASTGRAGRTGRAPRSAIEPHPIPPLHFPEELPVSALRETIGQAILDHPVVIVAGETGSGKTTQLPKICLALGRGLGAGGTGLIGHTQPRRLAATATARRIAEELGTPLGEHVGFKIRFNDHLSPGASVKLMTDGILLAETQGDPSLRAYDTIIIDEAHERSLNIDFLLGYLTRLLPRRPDLKLIVTSATIDAARFAEHFALNGKPAPVVEVSGRLYPVEVRYRPPEVNGKASDAIDALVDAVDEACSVGEGDVLVFLPGEREIREAAQALRGHHPAHTEILPLFARLSAAEQERVFARSNARRIVLATNVAETSLTVPGIRFVVDTGVARVKRYSYRNKVEQLRIEPISQAAARQRAGRCGRVAAGVAIRLYAEDDYAARPAFSEPEILRSSLASVILRMKSLELGELEDFPFLEAPSARAITDGYQLLGELGAVDDARALTRIGHELARLPLDPRLGRMIIAAREGNCLTEMLVVASALSVQDPRDRPLELQAAADEAHKRFVDEKSEFLSDLKLWKWYDELLTHKKSNRQLRDACRASFISPNRMREWRDVHGQLAATVAEHGWRLNLVAATYEELHVALTAGLLGNIGCKSDEEPHYLGARGIKFYLWPGATIAKKNVRWLVAAELVETSRLYARQLARIEPDWIERVGAHLLRRSTSEPHWEKHAGKVVAFERATLYGLVVYQQRRVDFARIDPALARTLFLREGLVAAMREDSYEPRERVVREMLAHNRRQIAAIEQLEHKARRPDVLVDDALILALLESVVPEEVVDARSFERWYVASAVAKPHLLYLEREELMRHEAAGVTTEAFPKSTVIGGIEMALSYHFEPGAVRDGVTLTVPLYALNQVDPARADWLVPGLVKEKVQALAKSLPQKLRRHCVPLPEYAEGFRSRHAEAPPEGTLVEAIIADLRAEKGLVVSLDDFKRETVPLHLWMNFKVVDEHGRQLGMGRNLDALKSELGDAAQRLFRDAFLKARAAAQPAAVASGSDGHASGMNTLNVASVPNVSTVSNDVAPLSEALTDWTFGSLPEVMAVRRGGQELVGYPALVDHGASCAIEVFDDEREARAVHLKGLCRLFYLKLRETVRYLGKNLPDFTTLSMLFAALGTAEELREQILLTAVARAALAEPLPTDAASFEARAREAKARLTLLGSEIARLLFAILSERAAVERKLASARAFVPASRDIAEQLARLFSKQFVLSTPPERLAHFPRYLKAAGARLDKLKADPARDAKLLAEFAPLEQAWQRAVREAKGTQNAQLDEFRWLLEELRVALFAQELRTPMPVSVKRLQKVWQSLPR